MKRKAKVRLSAAKLLEKCQGCGRELICAGQALALRSLLDAKRWSTTVLKQHSRVSRQLIEATLELKRFPTSDKWQRIARTFGMELFEFDLLALFELRAVMPL